VMVLGGLIPAALLALPTSAYISASCRTAEVYPIPKVSIYELSLDLPGASRRAEVLERTIGKVHNL